MSAGRYDFGHTLNSQVGLVMVGGTTDSGSPPTESTIDGIGIDNSTVAELEDHVYANCLASVDDATLISFGGLPAVNYRDINVHTIGSGGWEVSIFQSWQFF